MKKLILCVCYFFNVAFASETLTYGEKSTVKSDMLEQTRELQIYLPQSYQSKPDQDYPVLYLMHGQFNFLSMVAVVDTLVNDNAIPEMIIVGVKSKGKELRAATNHINGEINPLTKNFRGFLTEELVPYIDKKYRTANYRILSGHSASGFFVLNTLLDEGDFFNAYFSFSPALGNDGEAVNRRIRKSDLNFTDIKTQLILTLADEGEEMRKPYNEVVDIYEKSKNKKLMMWHKEFDDQNHDTTRLTSPIFAFRSLFSDWKPTRASYVAGLPGLKKHYDNLKNKYDISVKIPQYQVNMLIYTFATSENEDYKKKLPALIKYSASAYKNGIDELVDIMQVMKSQGYELGSKQIVKEICVSNQTLDMCATS